MIAVDKSRRQTFDTDPKEIQKIYFIRNLVRDPIANT